MMNAPEMPDRREGQRRDKPQISWRQVGPVGSSIGAGASSGNLAAQYNRLIALPFATRSASRPLRIVARRTEMTRPMVSRAGAEPSIRIALRMHLLSLPRIVSVCCLRRRTRFWRTQDQIAGIIGSSGRSVSCHRDKSQYGQSNRSHFAPLPQELPRAIPARGHPPN
jgi:hypothetical protein